MIKIVVHHFIDQLFVNDTQMFNTILMKLIDFYCGKWLFVLTLININ